MKKKTKSDAAFDEMAVAISRLNEPFHTSTKDCICGHWESRHPHGACNVDGCDCLKYQDHHASTSKWEEEFDDEVVKIVNELYPGKDGFFGWPKGIPERVDKKQIKRLIATIAVHLHPKIESLLIAQKKEIEEKIKKIRWYPKGNIDSETEMCAAYRNRVLDEVVKILSSLQ